VQKIYLGAEPPTHDTGHATHTTSSNLIYKKNEPQINHDPKTHAPEPNLARSWDVKGTKITIHMRHDGRWTNGQPVTARDFVWSWLRTLSPQLAADYAYQFFGIKGAHAYNACDAKKQDCAALRDKVAVSAPDAYTIRIQLTSPQPWFIQQMAHTSFLAVNKSAVEKYGNNWTEAKNIVTNGPFKLTAWKHNASLTLSKWNAWRGARNVTLRRVDMKVITDGTTAERAFDTGETDVDWSGLPTADISRLKATPAYAQYPTLGTYYYGFNVKKITDVNQRRAMAFAIPRQSIIDNITQAGQLPATGFTPKGMPGFGQIDNSYLPAHGDMGKAEALMAKVAKPVKHIDLFFNNAPGHKEIAVAIQAAWKKLGLRVTLHQQEWQQFLQFLGPPPNTSVDVYRNGWIADFVDDINFLQLFTCDSGNNDTNFCDKRYDALVDKVLTTNLSTQARYRIYAQLEDMLTGPNGDMPIAPIYWYTTTTLEKPSVKGTFFINPLFQNDLTTVRVECVA
jgi:oligopeptide transport system substrate-binding protein